MCIEVSHMIRHSSKSNKLKSVNPVKASSVTSTCQGRVNWNAFILIQQSIQKLISMKKNKINRSDNLENKSVYHLKTSDFSKYIL